MLNRFSLSGIRKSGSPNEKVKAKPLNPKSLALYTPNPKP